jgi:L,D-transpeptidase YbiS
MAGFFIIQKISSLKRVLSGILLIMTTSFAVFVLPFWVQQIVLFVANNVQTERMESNPETIEHEVYRLNLNIERLNKKLDAFIPKNHYLIVNSTHNEFYLFKGKELVRKGKCSTGSYMLLEKNENEKWLFKTPKGEFKIRSKTTNPVWKKPDWAFIEEGLPVPAPNHNSRFEYGVLGDYALYLGQGYMIHGTLWKRYLGLPVTHGCIRMNDDDLKAAYSKLSIGSKVYIF